MPRLPPSLIRTASRQSKHLPLLLRQCRTLESASNELRWLKTHADKTFGPDSIQAQLAHLVARRARGEPLQYILGDQPFGDLEILCRPNVLIPRTDTETYTTSVVKCLSDMKVLTPGGATRRTGLRILDLCSGSGCISLLLHSLLRQELDRSLSGQSDNFKLQILGLDLSEDAVRLARGNLNHNIRKGLLHASAADEIAFHRADILQLASMKESIASELARYLNSSDETQDWDVLISNPPYVSPKDYAPGGPTEKSVRNFEPRMALVPPHVPESSVSQADLFYPRLLDLSLATGVKLLILEVGDEHQAERVQELVSRSQMKTTKHLRVETWYDDEGVGNNEVVETRRARAVVVWRSEWAVSRLQAHQQCLS